MSDDILARLREMAGTVADEPKPSAKAKAKPKVEEFTPTPVQPEAMTGIPSATPALDASTAVDMAARIPSLTSMGVAKSAVMPSGITVPVVVLDDGETFSDLRGAKVCYVEPDATEITADAHAAGIEIGDLLTLADAIKTILRIVG